ncbi:MAG: preprotein translocase subunit SecE [Ruminococcaceae bacterium]|nr:preprotein translocase subunit SecE [Oscillospiraceae bacterium]
MSEKKKSNIFVRAAKSIGGYFRELKSELKKVVWPSAKQVRNNTGVVITVTILVAVLIALLDFGFQTLFAWILR